MEMKSAEQATVASGAAADALGFWCGHQEAMCQDGRWSGLGKGV
jgi:hypothetical protein